MGKYASPRLLAPWSSGREPFSHPPTPRLLPGQEGATRGTARPVVGPVALQSTTAAPEEFLYGWSERAFVVVRGHARTAFSAGVKKP